MNGMNLDLFRAMSLYDPAGRPKDPHAHHLAEHLAVHRAARRGRWRMRFRRLQAMLAGAVDLDGPGKHLGRALLHLSGWRRYSTSTVAQVSKQTPPARAITPIVARPPRPRSGPKTSTRRSERPEETLCTSS